MQGSLVAGARIRVRDSEWVVAHVARSATSGAIVHATGLSGIVRDKEAIFVEGIENARGRGIEVVDPTDVMLVPDASSGFADIQVRVCQTLRRPHGIWVDSEPSQDGFCRLSFRPVIPDNLTMVQEGAFYVGPYSYRGQHADFRVHPQRHDLVAKAIKPTTA
jgi:hypothetical protein